MVADALVGAGVTDFIDKFTGISFYLFWFAFGLIILMWFFTFFKTIFYNQNVRNASKYG